MIPAEANEQDPHRESPTSSQNTQEQTAAAAQVAANQADGIDYSLYTRAMLMEEKQDASKPGKKERHESVKQLFSKKPLLQISKLRPTYH